MEIYGAFDVDRNQRIQMLEKIRMNLETNHILLKNINEIEKITGFLPSLKKEEKEEVVQEIVENRMNTNQQQKQTPVNIQPNTTNQSNLTIFNLINEGKNKNNKNKNNKKNETTLVNNMMSAVQGLTGTTPQQEEEEPKEMVEEVSVQNALLQEKKEKVNMSKKVSQKLNQMPKITNNTARSELNQFLMERLGRTNLYHSSSQQQNSLQQPSTQTNLFNSTSQPNRSRNQNIFI